MKKCKACGEEKELTEYHKSKTAKDKREGRCKKCRHAQSDAWAKANPEKRSAYYRKYMKKTLPYHAQRRKAYVSRKAAQMPPLAQTPLCTLIMNEIYWNREFLVGVTGIEHDVDHIHPLSKGGEHAPWNLQVLTATENRSKGNKLVVPL